MVDPMRPWLNKDAEKAEASPAQKAPVGAEPWLTVVGIGDAGLSSLTSEGLAAIAAADTIFGGERHLAMLDDDTTGERIAWASPFSDGIDALIACTGSPTVVLATGDPLWFGVGATLARHVEPGAMRVIANVAAFQMAAARLGWALQDCRCLTVHGRPVDSVARHLAPGQRLIVYSADGSSPQALARLLTSRGYGQSRMVVHEHLGGTAERILETSANGFDLDGLADLNTVAIDCVAGRGAQPRPTVPGLPDDAFLHDGKMTKRVLRALAIAALEPLPGRLLWDVGAGAGSIAVEWLRACERCRAIAIEPKPERRAMIFENAAILGVPEIEIIEGSAPAAFAGLDAPDSIFIGGGLTDGIFDEAFDALKPGGRLVAHAVTLESEAILLDLHARLGGELMRIAIDRAEKVGPYRGFKPAMPVIHWHVTKPDPKLPVAATTV